MSSRKAVPPPRRLVSNKPSPAAQPPQRASPTRGATAASASNRSSPAQLLAPVITDRAPRYSAAVKTTPAPAPVKTSPAPKKSSPAGSAKSSPAPLPARCSPRSPPPPTNDMSDPEVEIVPVSAVAGAKRKSPAPAAAAAAADIEPQVRVGSKRSAPSVTILSSDDDEAPAERLRLLTWNVDMDSPLRALRMRALIAEVRRCRADLVLLQEVTDSADSDGAPSVLATLQRALCTPPTAEEEDEDVLSYNLTMPHCSDEYFCVLLARRGLLEAESLAAEAYAFKGSHMGRGLIALRGRLAGGAAIHVYTSHLESMKIGAPQRKAQFKHIVAACRESAEQGATAIFAGDTNLRENEVPAADVAKTAADEAKRRPDANTKVTARKRAKIDAKMADAWLVAGADAQHKFTWDMQLNDNLDMSHMQHKIRTRYDRIFLLAKPANFPDVVSFRLLGTERLESTGKFISDHFGLCCDLDVYK